MGAFVYRYTRVVRGLIVISIDPVPELTQAALSQKPDKESLTPTPPLNPAFLIPPPTDETKARSAKGFGLNL